MDGSPLYECAPTGTTGSVHCYLRVGPFTPGKHEIEVRYFLKRAWFTSFEIRGSDLKTNLPCSYEYRLTSRPSG